MRSNPALRRNVADHIQKAAELEVRLPFADSNPQSRQVVDWELRGNQA
ncbi:MAG: hypothetical protein R3A13_09110 [Bdellovibrionota bacterium]